MSCLSRSRSRRSRKYLVYRSIEEFVAERFHTDEQFFAKINPKRNWRTLKPGDRVKVPNVTEFKIEDVVLNKAWGKEEILSERHVIVDTSEKIAAIWEGDKLVATFPVTPGQEKFIYRGDFEIKVMVNTPTFRYDKSMLKTGKRSDEFHQLPPWTEQPSRDLLGGDQQERHRAARHREPAHYRPLAERRLHPLRQLGRDPALLAHPPGREGRGALALNCNPVAGRLDPPP